MVDVQESGSIILDMDDVLTYTCNDWFKYIYDKKDIFKKYIDFDLLNYNGDPFFPMKRPVYNFADWLLKKDLSLEDELIGRRFIMESYLEHKDFYDKVKINDRLVRSIINLVMYKKLDISNVYIVTRTFEEFEKNKVDCIKRIFSTIIDRVNIIFVELNENKSDVVKDIDKVSLIYDDELTNIYDYLLNCNNINRSIIMIPITGYNSNFDERYANIAKEKEITIKYYN